MGSNIMASKKLSKATEAKIKVMVDLYTVRRVEFANLAKRVENDLVEHNELRKFIHSTKKREKDPTHLFDKLQRKALEAKKNKDEFGLNSKNIFNEIGDLAGVRLLHIHADQLSEIHPLILKILEFHKYKLREKPLVYIWDLEREEFLKSLGLNVIIRPKMYTSVHYVAEHLSGLACEIQVRTLAEELWGEVSHTVNYPHETNSVACTGQLSALARLASGCTRLVDSIYASKAEHEATNK